MTQSTEMPRVVVYAIAHNEAVLLPFFARHYRWAERVVIFDDESTDGSRQAVATFHNVEIRAISGNGVLDNGFLVRVKNECWKECRGQRIDWVIVVDCDEFVWSPDLAQTFRAARATRVTLLQPGSAFDMIGQQVPDSAASLPDVIRRGVPNPGYAKPCIFSPDNIAEINFGPGCHDAAPTGEVHKRVDDSVIMLHYIFLSADFWLERAKIRRDRRSAADAARGWGIHHAVTDEENRAQYERAVRDATLVIGDAAPAQSRSL